MKKSKKRIRTFILIVLIMCLIGTLFYAYKNIDNKKEVDNTIDNSNVDNNVDNNEKDKSNNADKVADSYLGKVTNSSSSKVDSSIQDITPSFTNPTGTEAYLTQNGLDLLVEHHQMQLNDMKLSYAMYDIDYQSVKVNGNKITIKFLEDDHYKFNYLGDTESDIYDVSNTIVINNNNGTYTIDSLRVIQGHYIMFTNEVDTTSSSAKTTIDSLKTKYIKQMKEEVETNKDLMNKANTTKYVQSKTCDYEYDRDAAVSYSYKYITTRNSEYEAYDSSGGNCANFVSQSIHAGGIPMDYTGTYQWKHYSSALNTSNTATGRSASWVSTTAFYEYASNNTGAGLCADADINIFYAEPGDGGQVGYKGYSHSILIVSQVKKDGKVVDLLVNSNTVNLKDYPLLGYVYPNKRVIKILGYNK